MVWEIFKLKNQLKGEISWGVHVWANDTCHTSEFQKEPKVWQGMRWRTSFSQLFKLGKNDKFIFIKFYHILGF
jgi:hypothetical protein